MRGRAAQPSRLLLLAAALLCGCSWGTVSEEEFRNEYGSLALVPFVGQSLFVKERAAEFVGFVERRLGRGVRLRSLTVHAANAMFEAASPSRPDRLDQYFYSDGAFTLISPVQLSGAAPRDAELFALTSAGIEHLPEMIARGCSEMRPGRGATPYADWKREAGVVRVAVYCSSPRRSGGYVVFDVNGKVLAIQR
jgi:hypothetical protein